MFEQLLTNLEIIKRISGNVSLLNDNYGVSTSGSFAAVNGNGLYTGGGRQASGTGINSFKRYDLVSKEWTNCANLPVVLTGAIMLSHGTKLYVFGGTTTTSTTYVATLYEYDTTTDTWRTLASSPNGARVWHSGAISNGKLYFFGGYNGSQRSASDTYDIATNTWTTIAPLAVTRHGHCSVAVDGIIYIFGGLTNAGGNTNNDIIAYSIANNTYTNISTSLSKPPVRCYSSIITAWGRLYVFGGYTDGNGSSARADLWEFNIVTSTWRQVILKGDTLTSRAGFSYGSWNGEFHILNGRGTGSTLFRTDHLKVM